MRSQLRLLFHLSMSCTRTTGGLLTSFGLDTAAGPTLAVMVYTNSVTRFSAAQSSRLYVTSLCCHSSPFVASHLLLQTVLWIPEAFGSVHEQPRQPPISFKPFE